MKSIFNTEAKLGKEYRRLSLDDEEGNRSASPRVIFTKQGNKTLYACILFLALGWLATCAYVYRTRFQSNGLLHVYYNTPIPKDVFKPVKKVFHRDERYVGWNDEVNRNWDRLVAGKSHQYPFTIVSELAEMIQVTTPFGSRILKDGVFHRDK